jgi:hypothetical protein
MTSEPHHAVLFQNPAIRTGEAGREPLVSSRIERAFESGEIEGVQDIVSVAALL